MLRGAYFPAHEDNRMKFEGDVEGARFRFFQQRPPALVRLLRQRYEWMNPYLVGRKNVIELGSGAGLSREFLACESLILTDVVKRPWIDMTVDALDLPFEDNSLDAIICSHIIHHLYSPKKFFDIAYSKLKADGIILIQEINTSLMMRVLLRLMRHEGWSYDVDVFDENTVANDPKDPWSANCAIPELLFRDEGEFIRRISGFRFCFNRPNECLLFPFSGGVIAKTTTVNLPEKILDLVERLDALLVSISAGIFALGRSVVLEKVSKPEVNGKRV